MLRTQDKKWKCKMKRCKIIIFLLIGYILLLILFPQRNIAPPREYVERCDTITRCDTLFLRDTLVVEKPTLIRVEDVRMDTVFTMQGDTMPLITQRKTYTDTICTTKSDTAIVTSIIQGVDAMLLSTEVDLRRQERTNYITVEKVIREKPRKWTVSPQIGVGYGLFNRKADVFLGIGVSYNF